MPDYELEHALQAAGYSLVCGVDEAGRGPLAGPVCAAAVILKPDATLDGLDDSKKLTEKKRELLFDKICEQAIAYGVALVDNRRIDTVNILNATFEAMEQAVASMHVAPDYILIDGNRLPEHLCVPARAVVKGDAKSMSVAAASVLAKVTRDRLMLQMDRQYPQYQFAKHKGYGTKLHVELLHTYGPCPIHRRSFLKNILPGSSVL